MGLVVLLGETASGKSTIQNELCEKYGYKRIISYTNREPRECEKDGVDYHFVDKKYFIYNWHEFLETTEYEGERIYGTKTEDYIKAMNDEENNYVVVLTPSGFRELKRTCGDRYSFLSYYLKANLNTRVKRYIDRCGDNFTSKDLTELSNRVQRDFGMFDGVGYEVNHLYFTDDCSKDFLCNHIRTAMEERNND